jgi:hypothetical protein
MGQESTIRDGGPCCAGKAKAKPQTQDAPMLTWALIAIMSAGAEPELIGMFEDEQSCLRGVYAIAQQTQKTGQKAESGCYLFRR